MTKYQAVIYQHTWDFIMKDLEDPFNKGFCWNVKTDDSQYETMNVSNKNNKIVLPSSKYEYICYEFIWKKDYSILCIWTNGL